MNINIDYISDNKGVHLRSFAELLLEAGLLYHVTSGVGTPVTLHTRTTVSPSRTTTSSLESSSMIFAGTENRQKEQGLARIASISSTDL